MIRRLQPSILRNILISFLAFGIMVGAIFPLYARFFVEWKPGMYGWFVAGCLIAGAMIGAVNYLLVRWLLVRKLRQIAVVTRSIGEGDITRHCELRSHDVIGEIIDSFNRMAETLRRIIGQLRSESEALQAASTSMVSATETAVGLSGEQQQQVDQVATAMNELSASAEEVARHAAETARATHEADEQGNTAKVVVVEAMGAVDVLADMVQGAAEVIGRLEQESENIGKVLAVINDIAEQTNLLALNAAIEAARAGEQGRGFAVVADEVRTLANRTQKSTEEISAMIERLQGGSREAVSAMEAGREQATNGVALTEQAAEALAIIAGAITTISEMSEQIAQASREQTTVVEDVNRSVSAISGLCDRTTESMGHIDGTARELARLTDEMQGLIAGFRTA